MAYRILYHRRVLEEDIPSLSPDLRRRIARAIGQRLVTQPTYYGGPLRHRLKGYWKLRVGDYRVVYTLRGRTLIVIAIRHRKLVYALAPQRLIWKLS